MVNFNSTRKCWAIDLTKVEATDLTSCSVMCNTSFSGFHASLKSIRTDIDRFSLCQFFYIIQLWKLTDLMSAVHLPMPEFILKKRQFIFEDFVQRMLRQLYICTDGIFPLSDRDDLFAIILIISIGCMA